MFNKALLNGVPGWVLNGASLDLDFANGRAFSRGGGSALTSLLTTTRASTGYAANSSGLLVSFLSNIPRITDLGLLVEQASTNSIRNNSMTGAVAGTPGTLPTNWSVQNLASLTQQIVGTGTDTNGLPYIDLRFSGTPNATTILVIQFDGGTQIAALSGQTWTSSNYITLAGGALTNISSVKLDLTENNGAGSFLTNSTSTIVPTSSAARYSLARTLNQATTAFVISKVDLGITSGSPVDVTLRITAPQLEQLAFATSPILTTTVAVTRAADSILLAGSALTASLASKAAYAQTNALNPNAANSNDMIVYFAGAGQQLRFGGNTVVAADNNVNAIASATIGGAGTFSGRVKAAYGYDSSSYTAVANGGTRATSAFSWGSLTGTVSVGNRSTDLARAINGYLERVAFGSTKGMFDGATQ